MNKIRPVILCGGSGTRLWPISRSDYPKQFVDFPKAGIYGNSLFNYALSRLAQSELQVSPPLILASENYKYLVDGQLSQAPDFTEVLYEPTPKNTAPSLTLAALYQLHTKEDCNFIVMPSDQAIDNEKFREAVSLSLASCEAGAIVLIGVKPTYPETGYGYIKACHVENGEAVVDVERFEEKPNLDDARQFVRNSDYLWNSGIFILKASTWIDAIKKIRPDIYTACLKAIENTEIISDGCLSFNRELFSKIPSESIDYAVIEKCLEADISLKVFPFDGYWTDLGSWKSVFNATPKDENGNFSLGKTVLNKTENSLVVSTHRPVAVNGLSNIGVIETDDAILVSDLSASQDVKVVVDLLKTSGFSEAEIHSTGYRPWGTYEVLGDWPGYKIKRITVNPYSSLSLQRHKCRDEHWIVVEGKATVQKDEQTYSLNVNDSIFISKNQIHRLTNSTDKILVVIEIQIGSYLGEDDIERLEDIYGRV